MSKETDKLIELLEYAKDKPIGNELFKEAEAIVGGLEDAFDTLISAHKSEICNMEEEYERSIATIRVYRNELEEKLLSIKEGLGYNLNAPSLMDDQKALILNDLRHNMSLEDLEHLEMLAAQYLKEVRGQEYFSMNRIINANAI